MATLGKISRDATEAWMEDKLGVPFVQVRFLAKGAFVVENQVADPETIHATIDLGLRRMGARYAVWFQDDAWQLTSVGGVTRACPSQEAAEMLAIHGR